MFGFKTIVSVLSVLAVASAAPASELAKRQTHSGKATYFEVGLGACGWESSNTDFVVALDSPIYEANSGSNCGQGIRITNTENGNTATATVVDECPGCADGSLDMSPSLFSYLAGGNMDEGVFPISWHFLKRS